MHLSHNAERGLLGQTAEDWYVPTDDRSRDVFEAPARSSGRLAHMTLAFRLIQLSMDCRISHPVLSAALEEMNDIAISHQRADDNQLALLTGKRVPVDALDLVPVDEHEFHPFDAEGVLAARAERFADEVLARHRAESVERYREAQSVEAAAEVEETPALRLAQAVGARRRLVERGTRNFAERRDGLVARVLAAVGLRRAA